MENWNDADFARAWATENPADDGGRKQGLDLLIAILANHLAGRATPTRTLDLGCGHGVIAERVLREIAGTTVVGVDGSPPMLDMARERLEPYAERFMLTQVSFETMTTDALIGGPFDAAIAVQSIHNCSDEGKQRTLASVRSVMTPGGMFLQLDRIRLVTPALFGVYRSVWDAVGSIYNRQQNEGATFAEHDALRATRGDKPGSLEQNLLWLREAGFAQVAAVQVVGIRALIAAVVE